MCVGMLRIFFKYTQAALLGGAELTLAEQFDGLPVQLQKIGAGRWPASRRWMGDHRCMIVDTHENTESGEDIRRAQA